MAVLSLIPLPMLFQTEYLAHSNRSLNVSKDDLQTIYNFAVIPDTVASSEGCNPDTLIIHLFIFSQPNLPQLQFLRVG